MAAPTRLATPAPRAGRVAARMAAPVMAPVMATVMATLMATLMATALGGCGSAPLPAPGGSTPLALPAAWSDPDGSDRSARPADPLATASAPAATDLARWWQRFDDPLLAALIAQALNGNPNGTPSDTRGGNTRIDSARASLRQAQGLRDAAAAALAPTLGLSASAQRSRSANLATANRFAVGLDGAWAPDLSGARHAAVDAADARLEAQAATLVDVQVAIAAELALAYIDLRAAQARQAIAQVNLTSQQETLQLTRWREQAGLGSALESEQARAAAAQTEALLPVLRTLALQSGHAIAVLTGQPPAALDAQLAARADPVAALPQAPAELTLALPAETLRQRADVRAAEASVRAAWAEVAQADAARAPSLRLSGTLGLNAATLAGLGGGAAGVGALLASAALPLLDGGAAHAQSMARRGALDAARAAHRATVLAALRSVEDTLAALRGDRARLALLQQAAAAAASAAELARQRQLSGLVDFQTVLETQRSQLATQDGVASARATVGADHVRLYQGLGGGWAPAAAP